MESPPHLRPAGVPAPIRNGLTELHAYAMCLDAESDRLAERLDALDALDGAAGGAAEARTVRARRREIADELDLLRATIAALRRSADPTGRYL